MDDYRNPVKDLILGKDNVNKFLKVIGNTYADLMIIKGLNLRTSFGVDYRGSYYRAVDKNGVKQTVRAVMKSSTMSATIRLHFLEYQWTNQINYNGQFGKHSIGAVVGMEFTKAESEAFYARKDGLTLEDRDYAF